MAYKLNCSNAFSIATIKPSNIFVKLNTDEKQNIY